jgi:signal transduction histidine kinase
MDARAARVALRGAARGLTLLVSDEGRGFEPASGSPGASLGLAGMRERLRLVGGEMSVDSRPGGGTMIAAAVSRPALATAADGARGGGGHE